MAAGIASILSATAAVSVGLATGAPGAAAASGKASPIKHVIEVMLENHTFDNIFGTFPGADGIPAGATLPNPNAASSSAPDVHPVFATPNEGDVMSALNNGRGQLQMSMDYQPGTGYQMDHFTLLPANSMASITEFGPDFTPNQQYLAQHFELADHNFQPLIAPTQPNVMAALNGTSHGWYYNNFNLNDPQPWNSIFDEMTAAERSWKIYYGLPREHLNGTIWEKIVPPDHLQDITTGDQFISDVTSGSLPEFSFVRPGYGFSGEAEEDLGNPDLWVGQLVNAVAHSQYWDSTAIFVTYDEGGGFWDHAAPPAAREYGTRTPMTIISPYARPGVYHQQTTNVSILSFMQKLWKMHPLTPLNKQQNDLTSAFNFGQTPLPAPDMPVAPPDALAFHKPGNILSNIDEPAKGKPVSIGLMAETPGLSLDSAANGPIALSYTPPPGVTAPAGNPTTVMMTGGQANFTLTFPTVGYYRVAATGPNGSLGWATIDVGTTPATAPAQ
ncbi:phospholipase C [Rugosimonospora africana]|uniref:phospholipase C n=1 Tax=Rugosimonospora africana TaxID=556532 RepID=UPI0019419037|nr:alkaline phosphatase family protein [Rugosimonospora africana]